MESTGEATAAQAASEGEGAEGPNLSTTTGNNPPASSSSYPNNNNSNSNQREEKDFIVSCRCESARSIVTLLECLRDVTFGSGSGSASERIVQSMTQTTSQSFGTSSSAHKRRRAKTLQPVTVFCSPQQGLTFQVFGSSKQSQASLDMPTSLFSSFDCPDEAEFCVNLSTLLECLKLVDIHAKSHFSLTLTYHLSTEVLQLELDDSGFLCTAAVPGMMPPDDEGEGMGMAATFGTSTIVARMLLDSTLLKDHILPELEWVPGATAVTISMSDGCLELAAIGHSSQCLLQIEAANGRGGGGGGGGIGGILQCQCPSQVQHTFPLPSLLQAFKGLELAQETCLSVNEQGIMAIQHQVLPSEEIATNMNGESTPTFLDFILVSLADDDEDEFSQSQSQASQSQSQVRGGGWSATMTPHDADDQSTLGPPPRSMLSQSTIGTSLTRDHSQSHRRTQQQGQSIDFDDRSSTDSEGGNYDRDEEEDDAPSAVAPLFETVPLSMASASVASPHRRRRQRRSSTTQQSTGANMDDGATHPLEDTQEEEGEEDYQRHRHRQHRSALSQETTDNEEEERQYCSSPELVYGE